MVAQLEERLLPISSRVDSCLTDELVHLSKVYCEVTTLWWLLVLPLRPRLLSTTTFAHLSHLNDRHSGVRRIHRRSGGKINDLRKFSNVRVNSSF